MHEAILPAREQVHRRKELVKRRIAVGLLKGHDL
jgi:hypothetical protein